MTPIPDKISNLQTVLVGDPSRFNNRPTTPWNAERMAFLADFSKTLLAMDGVRELPDVVAFAFWARRANLKTMKERFADDMNRMGLGLTFHICPANTPVNLAFTLAFGLLAGNSCALRLPGEDTPTTEFLIRGLNRLLEKPEYNALGEAIMLVRYGHDDDVTAYWMGEADGRVIWGGDATVSKMRQFNTRPRSRGIVFSDRYSCSVLNAEAILDLGDEGLKELAQKLHNDIYIMDQAACSSPQLVAWTGDGRNMDKAQDRVWSAVAEYAEKHYMPAPAQLMDKFVNACNSAIENVHLDRISRYGNILYRIEQKELDARQVDIRGYSGTVHEVTLSSLDDLAEIINEKYQTLTYFGYKPDDILHALQRNRVRGIDRIVPVGQALEMDILWDGYQMIASLSRIIDVR